MWIFFSMLSKTFLELFYFWSFSSWVEILNYNFPTNFIFLWADLHMNPISNEFPFSDWFVLHFSNFHEAHSLPKLYNFDFDCNREAEKNRKANQFNFLFWFPNQRASLMYETNLGNQRHKFICEAFHVAVDSAADTPGMGSGVFIFIRNVCH